jgi:hypothetical protein
MADGQNKATVRYEYINPNAKEEYSAIFMRSISEEEFLQILVSRQRFYWRWAVLSEEGTIWLHRAWMLCQDRRESEGRVLVAKCLCSCRTAQKKLLLFGHDIQLVNCRFCNADWDMNKNHITL